MSSMTIYSTASQTILGSVFRSRVGLAIGAAAISCALASGMGVLEGGDAAGSSMVDPVVAKYLTRSAVLDLGLARVPSPTDYQLAATLLSIASDLDPTNAPLARSVIEAAWSAGDLKTMIEATRRVIKIDPDDTVSLLRLVSSVINNQQTIEGRLKLYDRFLGDAGRSIDVSVRSRLALDAALLERESGNMVGFVERLRLATTLDMTNKAAASLAAQYHSQLTEDSVLHLEYQIKLLFADPLDANVHLTIARVLAREGAFESAQRFLENALSLFRLDSGRVPSMVEEVRLTLDWQLLGPQQVLDTLNPVLMDQRNEAQALIDRYVEENLPTDDLMQPEEILYDLGVDRIRLLASYNLDDVESMRSVLDDIERTVNNEIGSIGSLLSHQGVDQRSLILRLVNQFSNFQVMRAIVGLDSEKIRTDIEEIVKTIPSVEAYFSLIEPMALYSEGSYELALEEASKLSPTSALDLIRGLSYERLGRQEEAIEVFAEVSRSYALDSFGAFARSRLIHFGVGEMTLTDAGMKMVKVAQTVPDWIDQMNSRPSFFMYLEMSVLDDPIESLDQTFVSIRLQNRSPIPLAIGPSQPIDSRFLLLPRIDDRSNGFQGKITSQVIGLNHRLRLEPREDLIVTIPADSVQTQWLLQMQPNTSIRQRYRLLQGFRPRVPDTVLNRIDLRADASVFGIVSSPLGLTSESKLFQRLILKETLFTVNELIEGLTSDDEETRRRCVVAAAGRLLLPAPDAELSASEQTELVGTLMDIYTVADASERARMILLLPQRHQVSKMMAFDDHVVGLIVSDALIDSRVDPIVLAAALLTRTDASDSPIFEVLDQVSDPRLTIVAEIIRARIESFTPFLGTVGPGVDSIIRPNEAFGR